ncbi:MAG TPA: HupE/UreJ family protein [Thermoanaerobaculia bacterium]|nr:HupE/UreJ family protein [Thermoanaerobaculia bacterium]
MRRSGSPPRLGARLAICSLLFPVAALAHDVRPGYLSLTERDAGKFDVLFKVPASGETQLALEARLPPACRETSGRDWQAIAGATVERWTIDCGATSLESGEISIGGLELTLTDVLLRVEWSDGARFSTVLRPEAPAIRPSRGAGVGEATVPASGFLRLGVEHILGGVDHLLFVLCLVLLVDGARRLLVTITAFTLAHSVTLALATLGLVRVPSRPVEASIALSIVLLAVELVRRWRGESGMTVRRPWLVSFAFGLLHGLGFAGALSQVGLPPGDIPLALFLFNLGVEVGQVAFVALVLGVLAAGGWLVRRVQVVLPRWSPLVPAYAIGCVAAAWLLERVGAML